MGSSIPQLEIVIASGKGGVGKSTLASSLAILLAKKYYIIAVDADAEAPNLHIALGIDEWDVVEPYIEGRIAYINRDKCTDCGLCANACQFGAIEESNGKYYVNKWICEGCYTCSFVCPVKAISFERDIVAGHIYVKEKTIYGFPLVSSEITPGRPNSGKLVTEAKNKAKKIMGSKKGLILVDAAAGIGCQVISSIAGAHAAILVAEPTPSSLSDLKRIHKLAKHFGIPSMLVINKADISEEYREKILEYARRENIDYLGDIPYDENVPRSINTMKPLLEAYPDTKASKAIIRIAGKLVKIIDNISEWRLKHLPAKIEPFIPLIIKPGNNIVK
ncbi:MAG: ATP-binding protein [Staphylothermus sp.]|nr:ATP-binding protein [Staphylothermus sp.]